MRRRRERGEEWQRQRRDEQRSVNEQHMQHLTTSASVNAAIERECIPLPISLFTCRYERRGVEERGEEEKKREKKGQTQIARPAAVK